MSNDNDNHSEVSDSEYDETICISKLKKILENKKFMYSLYPSKHLEKTIQSLTKIIEKIENDNDIDTDISGNNILDNIMEDEDIEESIERESDEDDEDDEVDEDDEDDEVDENDKQYINIILSINPIGIAEDNINKSEDDDSEYKPSDEDIDNKFIGMKRSYDTRSKEKTNLQNEIVKKNKKQKLDTTDKELIE